MLLERNRPEEAATMLMEAIAENPGDAHNFVLLSRARMEIPGQRKQALEAIDVAVGLEPDNAWILTLKAHFLVRLDKDKEALALAESAIAADAREVFAWQTKTAALAGLKRWEEAEQACQEALKIDPDSNYAHNLMAGILRAQGRLEESGMEVGKLLERNAEDPNALATNGWAALQAGDSKKAEAFFCDALRIQPDFEAAREGLKQSYKARSLFYRLYLKWVFFMNRFTDGKQMMIIIGIYFAYRMGRSVFHEYPAIAALLFFLYIGFAFWGWLAPGIGDLLLLKDQQARLSLDPEEKFHGAVIGGGFFTGLCLLVAGMVLGRETSVAVLGGSLMGACIPAAAAFFNRTIGRYLFAGIALVILGIGIFACIQDRTPYILLAALLVMASTWLGSVSSLRHAPEY